MGQALAAMGDNPAELNFRGVVPLAAQEYWWREQYAPRQPKFFNKVHTGYDGTSTIERTMTKTTPLRKLSRVINSMSFTLI